MVSCAPNLITVALSQNVTMCAVKKTQSVQSAASRLFSLSRKNDHNALIDLFSLYVLFSHFRPRDVLMGSFLLSFHKLCVHLHVHKTTLERNYSLE